MFQPGCAVFQDGAAEPAEFPVAEFKAPGASDPDAAPGGIEAPGVSEPGAMALGWTPGALQEAGVAGGGAAFRGGTGAGFCHPGTWLKPALGSRANINRAAIFALMILRTRFAARIGQRR